MAVPPRSRQQGPRQRLEPLLQPRRLVERHGSERLEPRRRLAGLDDRRRRLVPQGLLAARGEPGARVGGPLRVGQLPLAGVAQRQARGLQPRRLHPVRVPPQRPQAERHQPAGDPRRLQAPLDRLPALGPRHQRRPDRRLVELRRPPARGLPQAPQRRRLEVRAGDAAARVRPLHGDGAGARLAAKRAPGRPERAPDRQLRLAPAQPRHARHPRQRRHLVQHQLQDPASARVVTREPEPLQRQSARQRGRAHGGLVPAAHGHPVDPRLLRRPPDPQRPAREPARRRRPRGLQGAGLRGRQRVPPAARRGDQGGGRDDDADPLPDAPLHARAGRPRGRRDLVRGPGLRDQDLEPRQEPGDRARGEGAREEHHRQPEPPLGA